MTITANNPGNALLPGYTVIGDYSDVIHRWNYWLDGSQLGSPVTVTYAFLEEAPSYDTPQFDDYFLPFTPIQRNAARAVFRLWGEAANIRFNEVSSDGIIQLANGGGTVGSGGNGFFPADPLWWPAGGDVEVNWATVQDFANDAAAWSPGKYPFRLLMHEIGHAIGLEHPSRSYGATGLDLDSDPFNVEDIGLHSVMSYNSVPRDGTAWYELREGGGYRYGYSLGDVTLATPSPYDIAAVQVLYGANTATRAGNTTYAFPAYEFVADEIFYRTIWDGGGVDTFDCSAQTRVNLIDLRPGAYSSIGYSTDPLADWPSDIRTAFVNWAGAETLSRLYNGSNNVAIAFDCIIENAIGGSAADRIMGNNAANRLEGRGGPDTLIGGGGNDTLIGGLGADRLVGGPGNDIYDVDSLDSVIELDGQGTDLVKAGFTYTLGGFVEKLVLTGGSAINGTGNALSNRITGNAAANVLDGRGGADTLIGGAGNDTYVVNHAGDTLVELPGEGVDLVKASVNFLLPANVEKLTLVGTGNLKGTGNGLPNTLIGNSGANRLSGGGGADSIYGKAGADTLTGGAGADRFFFDTRLGSGNVDLITDFAPGTDKICLDDDIFTALGPVGPLASSNFALGGTATTPAHRILYDAASGALYYDPDGTGPAARVRFATLGSTMHPVISATDIQIVA